MRRYFIYARANGEVSNKGDSAFNQVILLEKYAKLHDLKIAGYFFEITSGNSTNNPEFNKMFRKLMNKDAEGILCTGIDRLTRNALVGSKIIELAENDIEIVTPSQTFSRESKENLFLLHLMCGISNLYRERMSEAVKRGLALKKARESKNA